MVARGVIRPGTASLAICRCQTCAAFNGAFPLIGVFHVAKVQTQPRPPSRGFFLKAHTMVTVEDVRKLLSYDAETGEFRWKVAPARNVKAGDLAGSVHRNARTGREYRRIWLKGNLYLAHRLAWLHMTGRWPAAQIDHRDGNGQNNQIANLREATRLENLRNRGSARNNTSGFKGVSWHAKRGKWESQIRFNGRKKYLGRFDSPEAAYAAYCAAAAEFHGEFARVA